MIAKHLHLGILLAFPALVGASAAQEQASVNVSAQPRAVYTERISESDLVRLRKQSQPFVSSSPDQSAAPSASANFADMSDAVFRQYFTHAVSSTSHRLMPSTPR